MAGPTSDMLQTKEEGGEKKNQSNYTKKTRTRRGAGEQERRTNSNFQNQRDCQHSAHQEITNIPSG